MSPRLIRMASAAVMMVLAAALFCGTDSSAAKPSPAGKKEPEARISKFMRAKLANAQDVLEGLTVEDYDQIAAGARRMVVMSKGADWSVIEGPIYAQYSDEFRRSCQQLIKAAEQKNIDAAGLAYVNLTLNCISCHQFVHSTQVAQSSAGLDAR